MYPPDATAPPTPVASGAEPPAVVSLLAGHLDDTGYPATLLDLAARGGSGWPAGSAGRRRWPVTVPGPRCPALSLTRVPGLPRMMWRRCWTSPTVTRPSPTRPRWVPPPVR